MHRINYRSRKSWKFCVYFARRLCKVDPAVIRKIKDERHFHRTFTFSRQRPKDPYTNISSTVPAIHTTTDYPTAFNRDLYVLSKLVAICIFKSFKYIVSLIGDTCTNRLKSGGFNCFCGIYQRFIVRRDPSIGKPRLYDSYIRCCDEWRW